MRRLPFAFIGLVLALASPAAAGVRAAAPAPPPVTATTFLVSGRGWGHGVGMSQYGALGYANDGWTYDQILLHYYTGVELGPAAVSKVRVLLAEAAGSVTVGSAAPFRVRDVFGKTYALDAGKTALTSKLRVVSNGAPVELAGPVLFLPGAAPLEIAGTPYRGQLEVSVAAGKLNAVDVVGLEQYLQGVVPREMPSAWPDEALKAQAVAARSYALSRRVSGKLFDLYADVRSQVYGGIAGEHPRATAAIEATKGEVMLWEGRPIDALFHSTSGGATLDAVEVFGTAVPYLVGVDDPHSDLSPVNRWGPTPVTEAALRRGLKLRAPVMDLKLTRGPSGRVARVQAVTTTGATTVSGAELRFAAGLRSTWITQLAKLSVSRPGGPVVYGRPVTVTGVATGVKGAALSQRVQGAWRPLPKLKTTQKLIAPAVFRITAGRLTGPVLRVPVAPFVTARVQGRTITGRVTPLPAGTLVQLQQANGRAWAVSAETETGADGTYALAVPDAGTYRVRVAPAQGFAQGLVGPVELP